MPVKTTDLIGRAPDGLTLKEMRQAHGLWVAVEIYSPATTPLRRIAATGDSAADCVRDLETRGLDPLNHEVFVLRAPF